MLTLAAPGAWLIALVKPQFEVGRDNVGRVRLAQDVALADVRKAAHMFETLKVPLLGVIETMSWFTCDQCEKQQSVSSA